MGVVSEAEAARSARSSASVNVLNCDLCGNAATRDAAVLVEFDGETAAKPSVPPPRKRKDSHSCEPPRYAACAGSLNAGADGVDRGFEPTNCGDSLAVASDTGGNEHGKRRGTLSRPVFETIQT